MIIIIISDVFSKKVSKISIRYKVFKIILKKSGIKKLFSLPTKELLQKVQKLNHKRCFKVPNVKRQQYKDVVFLNRFHCLKISADTGKSKKANLFLYGGGMILSPNRSDIKFAAGVGKRSKSDIWFPYYPLCVESSIDKLYKMIFEVYKRMVKEYGAENIFFLGVSSGAALSIGLCQYNHAQGDPLPMPKLVIACSSGCVPLSEEENVKMRKLSEKDIMVDAGFMLHMKDIMTHGKDIPQYMLSGARGDFTNMPEIHFYYSTDEVLYAEADYFEKACRKYGITYHMHIGKDMCHCYPMIPFIPEAKQALSEIIQILQ